MRYQIGLIVFLFLFLFSCSTESESLPIPEEKLVAAMIDMHLAEAALQSLIGVTKDSMADLYYEQIYTIHGITKEGFDQSMDLLQDDPKRLTSIYEQIMSEVEEKINKKD